MNQVDKNIIGAAEEIISNNGFFLIDLVVRGTSAFRVIEVYIDGEGNISAEDCANISREINSKLDGLLLESNYRLDVSSPGVDRPLKFLKQFPKHMNRNFEITYKKNEETKKLNGRLMNVEEDNLTFNEKGIEIIINFNSILKAKVTISFS